MNILWSTFLRSWDFRLEVILPLMLLAILYYRGWLRLRRRQSLLAAPWRLASYLGGLLLLLLALISPIDVYGGIFFFMHMIQHLLLVMFAPPLLLIASPFPVMIWGLPKSFRGASAKLFSSGAGFRHGLKMVSSPGLVWMVFIACFLGWHDPALYNAALINDWVHDLEHLTFFASAMLFWWHVTGAGPVIHQPLLPGLRIAFVLVTVPINMLAGVVISFAQSPIYTYYAAIPRVWGISVMEDQMLGGVIMWIPGSMMYIITAIILIAKQSGRSRTELAAQTGQNIAFSHGAQVNET